MAPTTTLVPVDTRTACPDCGRPPRTETVTEPALIRHGGHGATKVTRSRFCPCGWDLEAERGEVKP